MLQKAQIRKIIRETYKKTLEKERDMWSTEIKAKILQMPIYQQARHIMLYAALPDEANITSIIFDPSAISKKFWFPKIIDAETIIPHLYSPEKGFTTDSEKTPYQIKEPRGKIQSVWPDLDLIIVPGLAFDHAGHRLGRGKGFYDRFLRKYPQCYKVGICFPYQFVNEIPVSEHDINMDLIISVSNKMSEKKDSESTTVSF